MSAKKKKKHPQKSRTGHSSSRISEIDIHEIIKIAGPLCESENMELVHAEYAHEGNSEIVRIYIDKPDGVTLDDCVDISRQLSDLLDVNLNRQAPYRLEVSSPGTQRPLVKEADFEKFTGSAVKIRTENGIDGQKNFKGILSGISKGIIKLMVKDRIFEIPVQEITRARLVNDLGDNQCS